MLRHNGRHGRLSSGVLLFTFFFAAASVSLTLFVISLFTFTAIHTISTETLASQSRVHDVLVMYSRNTHLPASRLASVISQSSRVPRSQVSQILLAANEYMSRASLHEYFSGIGNSSSEEIQRIIDAIASLRFDTGSFAEELSRDTGISQDRIDVVVPLLLTTAFHSPDLMRHTAQVSRLDSADLAFVIDALARGMDIPVWSTAQLVSSEIGLTTEQIVHAVEIISDEISESDDMFHALDRAANISPDEVRTLVSAVLRSVQYLLPVSRVVSLRAHVSAQTADVATVRLIGSVSRHSEFFFSPKFSLFLFFFFAGFTAEVLSTRNMSRLPSHCEKKKRDRIV